MINITVRNYMTNQEKSYSGYNGTLILTETGIIIKRGLKGFLFGGGHLRGDKSIPYSSIVAVQLKRSGLTVGYIQLTLKGGSEAKAGLFQSTTDENSVNFFFNKNREFEEAKNTIGEKISQLHSPAQKNGLEELEKLAKLKKRGVITLEEFEAKKKQLLNI